MKFLVYKNFNYLNHFTIKPLMKKLNNFQTTLSTPHQVRAVFFTFKSNFLFLRKNKISKTTKDDDIRVNRMIHVCFGR